jgi:hypothetical protein
MTYWLKGAARMAGKHSLEMPLQEGTRSLP